jgi:hypothetical protein
MNARAAFCPDDNLCPVFNLPAPCSRSIFFQLDYGFFLDFTLY